MKILNDNKIKIIFKNFFSDILLYKIEDDTYDDIINKFPFINGTLHYGYLNLMTINSILFNYYTMNNCYFPIKIFPETQTELFLKKINFTNDIKNIEISEFKKHYDFYINKFYGSYGNMKEFSNFNNIFFKRYIKNLNYGIIFDKDNIKIKGKIDFENYNKNINDYFIDILRLFFFNINLNHTGFFLERRESVIQTLFISIERYNNCVNFLIENILRYQLLYSEIDFDKPYELKNIFDKYIVLKLNDLKKNTNDIFSKIDINKYEIVKYLTDFSNILSKIYINNNKFILYGQECNEYEWENSLKVLYNVLLDYCKLLAPLIPNISEYIFKTIKKYSKKHNSLEFVLLNKYPQYEKINLYKEEIYKIVNFLHIIKEKSNIIRIKYKRKYIPWEKIVIYSNKKIKEKIKENIHITKKNCNILDIQYKKYEDFRKDINDDFFFTFHDKKKIIFSISRFYDDDQFNLGSLYKLQYLIKSFLINKKLIDYNKNKIKVLIDHNFLIKHDYLIKHDLLNNYLSFFTNEKIQQFFNLQIISCDFNNDIILDEESIKIYDNGIEEEFTFKDKYNIYKLICEVENIKRYLFVIINEI